MKDPKAMTYKAMEREVSANRKELAAATPERKRAIVRRNHDLMAEMDRRWNAKEGK